MARVNGKRAGLSVAALWMGLTLASTASAQPGGLDGHECPPPLKYYYEGSPRLRFKQGCPRPICQPCTLHHYGYYQPCWAPSPCPPYWSHCPVPPPGATTPSAHAGRGAEPPTGDEKGPPPRPVPMKP